MNKPIYIGVQNIDRNNTLSLYISAVEVEISGSVHEKKTACL